MSGGVFISKGMQVGVPAGGIKIWFDDKGELQSSLRLQVHFNVVPTWIDLALRHLAVSKCDCDTRTKAWADNDENEKGRSLEQEFCSSMQAIMSAAVAFDAFYASLRDRVQVDPRILAKWRDNRTARYKQVAEVIRIAFNLKPRGTAALRQNLRAIFKLRDLAVHPDPKLTDPVLHPELQVGVEWRFFHFRFQEALTVVRSAVYMLHELATNGKPANAAVEEYAAALKPWLDEFKENVCLK